ncbi:MAG: hypothetical protein FWG34_05315 [Oscillospiraceae bacterium]|nr:hypothetical protein [Oscillospiraceae bacterium]
MRTYKEQTALILEKISRRDGAKKKRMKYIYSLSALAACLALAFAIYALPVIVNMREPDDAHGGGEGPGNCVHIVPGLGIGENYHSIDILFAAFIYDPADPGAFDRWAKEAGRLSAEYATKQCGSRYFTMDFFIQYFGIKREDFEKLYYNTYLYSVFDYDIDVLYSGDKDAVERYYAKITPERIAEMESRANLRAAKDELVQKTFGVIMLDGETASKEYEEWIKSLDKEGIIGWLDEHIPQEQGWFLAANSLWEIDEFMDYWGNSENIPVAAPDSDLAPPAA